MQLAPTLGCVTQASISPSRSVHSRSDPTEDPALALVRAMYDVAARVRRISGAEMVSGPAAYLLDALARSGPVRASDLAVQIGLDLSTVSRQVHALGERGLLDRTPDPRDRRAALVGITDLGRQELQAVWRHRVDTVRTTLDTWSPADRTALSHHMQRLAHTLGEQYPHPVEETHR